MTYALVLGAVLYLIAAALFYGFLLVTAKPETGKSA